MPRRTLQRPAGFPRWLTLLLVVVGLAVLGPPLLKFLLGALGVVFALALVAAKLALVVLAIYAAVVLVRHLLDQPPSPTQEAVPVPQRDPELRALDAELEQALRQARSQP